jgi:hypothetical protein
MSRVMRIIGAALIILFGLVALLCPLSVHSQQVSAFAGNAGADFDTVAPHAGVLTQGAKPAAPNPFQQPWTITRKTAHDSLCSDCLLFQADRRWMTALAQYAFIAPPEFYSFASNQFDTSDWDSVVSGTISAYINRSYTSYIRMSSDLDTSGQRRQAGALGEPGAQTFTMEWEVAHLLPSKLGPLEVAAGRYQQQLVSYSAFANGPLTTPFLGYSGSAAGFETSFTLPDRNISFSFRYGSEHLNATPGKAHATQFEFSWTW